MFAPMYRLVLLRHGKAAPYAGGGDHERPLVARGREAAARVGRYLAEEHLVPDFAAVSDALRTRETWDALAPELPHRIPHRLEPRLYEASAGALLDLLRQSPDDMRMMIAVGHNPGFADLALMLIGYGDRYAASRMRAKFPTCAFAILDFDVDTWRAVGPGLGRLDRFITPKSLGGEDD